MTLRSSQIVTAEDSTDSWAYDIVRHGAGIDMLPAQLDFRDRVVLPMVRGIMRERGDVTKMPFVVGVVMFTETNVYGHDLEIEVEYSKRGWRAIYAANVCTPSNVSCYMD